MNSIITEYYGLFAMYQSLRNQMLDVLSDADLSFTPGGGNPTLGALCREIGQVERSYIDSFTTWTHSFNYADAEPGIETRVDRLKDWYAALDQELRASIEALSEDDLQQRTIDRGGGFVIPPRIQLEIYKEALLIFYGKSSVYLRLLGKPLTEQWQHWIG